MSCTLDVRKINDFALFLRALLETTVPRLISHTFTLYSRHPVSRSSTQLPVAVSSTKHDMMECTHQVIRSALTKAGSAKKVSLAKPRSAYILFGDAYRKRNDQADKTPSFTEIAAAWKALPAKGKEPYEAQAQTEKNNFVIPSAPDDAPTSSVYPLTIKLKNEAQLDALVKKVAEDTIRQFMQELVTRADAGAEIEKIPKVGSIVAKIKESKPILKHPHVIVEYSPSTTMRPKVEAE